MARTSPRSWLLLVLASGQVVTPLVPAVRDAAFLQADRSGEPAIVPAGYAFAIWGLVELLSVGYAVWALARPTELTRRVAGPLSVVFAGFTVWLVLVAFVEPNWGPLAVFLAMLAGLLAALRAALAARDEVAAWPVAGRALLWGVLGVYTGWASIAVWANLVTAFAGSGAPITGTASVVAQLAVLAGATATAAAILRWTGGLLPYAGAVVWALTAVAIGAAGAGEPLLSGAAAVAVAVVVVLTAVLRLRGRVAGVRTPLAA